MAAADERIAASLGIPADVVKIHRNSRLQEGVHFTRAEGGRIDYTPEGEAALRADLAPEKKEGPPPDPPPPPSGPAEKKETAAAPVGPCAAVLVRLLRRYPNPIWVDIQASNGRRVLVRVRNNNLLSMNKRLLCREWPDGRWECCQRGQDYALQPLASAEAQTETATE